MKPLMSVYVPKNLDEIIGQDRAIEAARKNVKSGKAMLFYGPPGTGKTAAAAAAATENSLELLEVNSSDFRNKDQINSIIGNASRQRSLFHSGKIILIDEADGVSGTKDRGGLAALSKIIEESAYPIIITATDPWDSKFSGIRKRCVLVPFSPLQNHDVASVLKRVCSAAGIIHDEESLMRIARRSGGDARSAINDMQTLIVKGSVTIESMEVLGDRSHEESMPQAIVKVLKTTDPKIAITAFENVREDKDQQMLWVDYNMPKEYTKPDDLARAYEQLSLADVFSRRIRRWQHWRFLVYINALQSAGVAVSKDSKYKVFIEYKQSSRLLKMWWAKQKSMKKKAISLKIAQKTHASARQVLQSFHYFLAMLKDKGISSGLAEEIGLDKEEIAWVRK